jgi:adenylate cyclase
LGDGFLALFGCEENDPTENCLNAIRASLRMLTRVKALNQYISRQFSHQFRMRIGLHYGDVIIGEVGYSSNKQLTVIGNTVNIASRIESANKEFGTQILASQELIDYLPNKIEIGQVFTTQLRGQNRSHTLYEVIGFKQPDTLFQVQSTLDRIRPHLDEFTKLFFEQLFAFDPSLKPLFDTADIKNQKQMVINMVGFLTLAINHFDIIMPSITEMNERHIVRHVKPEDYKTAGMALVNVLEKYLGKDFTPEVRQIWIEFYEQIVQFVKS